MVLARVIALSLVTGTASLGPSLAAARPANARLIAAVERHDVKGVARALRRGADANALVGSQGPTVLALACSYVDPAVAARLVAAGANVNGRRGGGIAPLIVAARGGHLRTVSLLLRHGASVNVSDARGHTALALACVFGRYEVARLLLRRGANPNCRDGRRQTPLMRAGQMGQLRVVRLLLAYRADPRLRDDTGRSALDWARDADQALAWKLMGRQRTNPPSSRARYTPTRSARPCR